MRHMDRLGGQAIRRRVAGLAAVVVAAGSGAAQPETASVYGYDFVTIGDPGNRATTDAELSFLTQGLRLGAVSYEYRMATTEVTVGQWHEFVQAYAPIYDDRVQQGFLGFEFTGPQIYGTGSGAFIREGYSENRAARVSWEYAARYCNWLHNGKVNEAWAFENGAYDTSSFTQNSDGTWNHQAARNPDAKFWMPTIDEWVKAAHWDPEKNDGEGGYWAYPTSSDSLSIGNLLPNDGGSRNAGDEPQFPLDVGSFTSITSPWGLLDMAGGEQEMTESSTGGVLQGRSLMGSGYFDWAAGSLISDDLLGNIDYVDVFQVGGGLRLVSAVPAPGSAVALSCIFTCTVGRRRQR
ncbi:MAG: SUMF1/EgtB/PvdO family nonheme iron enzyme [Phycisphaerales bacterium JB040]